MALRKLFMEDGVAAGQMKGLAVKQGRVEEQVSLYSIDSPDRINHPGPLNLQQTACKPPLTLTERAVSLVPMWRGAEGLGPATSSAQFYPPGAPTGTLNQKTKVIGLCGQPSLLAQDRGSSWDVRSEGPQVQSDKAVCVSPTMWN